MLVSRVRVFIIVLFYRGDGELSNIDLNIVQSIIEVDVRVLH